MAKAIDHSDIFWKMSLRGEPHALPCDMMIRAASDEESPAVIINGALSGILHCIMREMATLMADLKIEGQIHDAGRLRDGGPLAVWYRSILGGVFEGDGGGGDSPSGEQFSAAMELPSVEQADFCLVCDAYLPMESSAFVYISLSLPPLWLRNRGLPALPGPSLPRLGSASLGRGHFDRRKLCAFRYCRDTGIWYASLREFGNKKRILQLMEDSCKSVS